MGRRKQQALDWSDARLDSQLRRAAEGDTEVASFLEGVADDHPDFLSRLALRAGAHRPRREFLATRIGSFFERLAQVADQLHRDQLLDGSSETLLTLAVHELLAAQRLLREADTLLLEARPADDTRQLMARQKQASERFNQAMARVMALKSTAAKPPAVATTEPAARSSKSAQPAMATADSLAALRTVAPDAA